MATAEIPFTQYLLPDGRKQDVVTDVALDVAAKARALIATGLRFECEMLSDYSTVSFTITHPKRGDLDIRVVPNGPGVQEAIEDMVRGFDLAAASGETGQ